MPRNGTQWSFFVTSARPDATLLRRRPAGWQRPRRSPREEPGEMMTTTPRTENSSESDSDLWQLVCRGSASAFEVLVRRYQSLVCSVAYSACGHLALSEDVAQETFWTAWRQRASLDR